MKKARFCKYGHDTWETGRYPSGNCAECSRARSRQWGVDHPGRIRARNVQRLYGITMERYEQMRAAQDGACAGCGGVPLPGEPSLCVDHDHATGRIRGLLCHSCNRGLGLLGDSADLLRRLAQYVEAEP